MVYKSVFLHFIIFEMECPVQSVSSFQAAKFVIFLHTTKYMTKFLHNV